ncbi:MAG TPA: hypothetical protein VHX62_07235 [Solirubrobacteraceae bacterium]|nr:hypothetical protein [Solirubrobacteraceae bacterium]
MIRRLLLLVAACAAIAAGALVPALARSAAGSSAGSPTLPGAPNCPVFPADNPWNQRVNQLPVAKDSGQLIARIGLDDPVHPDFGTVYDGAPNGIPYAIVTNATKPVPVSFQYASESDGHRYPLPRNVPIEGGSHSSGDRHVIVVNKDTCTDYELFAAYPHDAGRRWTAGSGAIFNLRSDHLRPAGWTSADAAGLPILAGLAIYAQVAAGAIDHALRFTAPCTGNRYVYPARHVAASCSGASAPPMGLRVRLKAGVNISHLPYQARVVAQALKTYGMILADNGSPWFISGAPNPHWNNDALHELDQLTGRDFQVVDTSSLPSPGR